jgi:hypothetical protein
LKGTGFVTSNEVAAATREGVAAKLADAVMAALGDHFECLSDEDVRILADLYNALLSAVTTTADAVMEPKGPNVFAKRVNDPPNFPIETGGGEAAGSPAASISAAPDVKGAISSPEDDSSADESPSGDGLILVELPVVDSLPN